MNKSQLQVYKFEDSSIRATADENGNPLFVGRDVALALGYATPQKAIRDHCKGVPKWNTLQTEGGPQRVRMISEGDMYRLIAGSKLPSAQKFESWIFDEVIPQIRRTGGYLAGQEHMTPEQMLLAGEQWLKKIVGEQKQLLEQKDKQIAEQAPKVLFADAVSASDGTCLVGELAKMITQSYKDHNSSFTIGQNRLFARLRKDGYLGTTGQNRNVLLQRYIEQGFFRIKETTIVHPDGHVSLNRTPKVTGRGQRYFLHKYGWKEAA